MEIEKIKSNIESQIENLKIQLEKAGTGDKRQIRNINDQIFQKRNLINQLLKKNKQTKKWKAISINNEIKFQEKDTDEIVDSIADVIKKTESVGTKVQKQGQQIEKLKEKTEQRRREQEKAKPKIDGKNTVNEIQKKLNKLNIKNVFTHHWKAAWSNADDNVYYYNTQTKARQWMDPTQDIEIAREKALTQKNKREKAVRDKAKEELKKLTSNTPPSNIPKSEIAEKKPSQPTIKASTRQYNPKNTTRVLQQQQQIREARNKEINNNPHHWVIEFINFILFPFKPDLQARNNILNSLNSPFDIRTNNYNMIQIGVHKLGESGSPLRFRIRNLKKKPNANQIIEKIYKDLLEKIKSSTRENEKSTAATRIKNLYDYFVNNMNPPPVPKPKLFQSVKKSGVINKFGKRKNDHTYRIYKTPLWTLTQKPGQKYIFKLYERAGTIELTKKEIPEKIINDLKNWSIVRSTQWNQLYKTGKMKVTTPPLKENKFKDDIKHFYSSHLSNTCFEYDKDDKELENIKGKSPSIKLQERNGVIITKTMSGTYWVSQPRNPVWKQNLKNHTNEIRFKPNDKLHGGTQWEHTEKRKNIKNKSKKAFIDLDKKIDLKNGWYMFELQNDIHDNKLTNQTAMTPINPALFFMKEEDLYFTVDTKDEEYNKKRDEWAKNRKILCEYEYRRFWVKKWESSPESQDYIKSIVDYNTTYYYCSSEKSKYKGLSDICSSDPLKALQSWTKNNKIKLNDIFTNNNDISVIKNKVIDIFENMILIDNFDSRVFNDIINKQTNKEGLKKIAISHFQQISVGNFLDNTINIPNLKSPVDELSELSSLNLERIRKSILEFIKQIENGLDELSNKSNTICTQSVNCIDEILKHIDTIYNFKNESTNKFNTIIEQCDEWIGHYLQIKEVGMELKDKQLINIADKSIRLLKFKKDNWPKQWKEQITNKKLMEVLNNLIKINFDKLLEGSEIQLEDITLLLNFTSSSEGQEKILTITKKRDNFLQRKKMIQDMFNTIQTKTNPDIKLDFNEYENKLNDINTEIENKINQVIERKEKKEEEERKAEEERIRKEKEEAERRRREQEKAEKIESMKKSIENVKKAKSISELTNLQKQINNDEDLAGLKQIIINEINTLKNILEKEEKERIEKSKKEIADNLNFILKNWKDDLLKKKYDQQKQKYRDDAFKLLQKALKNNIKIDNKIQKKLNKIKNQQQNLINKKENVDELLSKINNNQITLIKIYDPIIKLSDEDANKYSEILKDRIVEANDILNLYNDEGFVDKTNTIVDYIGQTEKNLKTIEEWIKGIELNNEFLNSLQVKGNKISISDNFEDITALEDIKGLKTLTYDDENKTPLNDLLVKVLNSVETKINNKIKELEDEKRNNTEVFEKAIKEIKDKIKEFDKTNKEFTDKYNELDSKKDIIKQLINISQEKQNIEESLSEDIGREEIKNKQNQLTEFQVQYVNLNKTLQRINEEELKIHFDSDILKGIKEINLDDINTDNLNDGVNPEDEIANIKIKLEAIKQGSEKILSYLNNKDVESPEDTFDNFKDILEIVELQRQLTKVVSEEASKENLFAEEAKKIEEKIAAEEQRKKEEEERKAAALLLAKEKLASKKTETKNKINKANNLEEIAVLLANLGDDLELGDEIKELKNKQNKLNFIKKLNDYNSKQLDSLVMHMNKDFKNMMEPGKTRANVWG
jgi:hypothetical protein